MVNKRNGTAHRPAITNTLRVLRAEKRITQEELAHRVGVTRVTINCIERGVYLPTLELALALGRFFGKPVEEIFVAEEHKCEPS